jgi:hypothetical protein
LNKEIEMRALAVLLIACAIAFPSVALAEKLTTDDQVRQALVGNTISGEDEAEAYSEFFHPDGRILGEDRQGRYSGHWMISGAQMCMRYYENGDKESNWDCSQVEIEGNKVIWSSDGERSTSTLIPGNPRGF